MGSSEETLIEVSRLLSRAARPLRVVKSLHWPPGVREKFLATGGTELPRVRYRAPDLAEVHEITAEARRRLRGRSPEKAWLRRHAAAIDRTASMLEAMGTRHFFTHSARLYGVPTDPLIDGRSTSLALARRIDRTLSELGGEDLGSEPEPRTAAQIARGIRSAVDDLLGAAAPRVVLTHRISAKASASARRIRLRKDATFVKEDIQQLVMHEAMVHVATTLNGRAQGKLAVLRVNHGGITRTQEGLAVFSELISGALGPGRLRRLAHRALAIQASIDGADFLDLYRYYLDQTGDEVGAYEDARRIVRGGLVTGGAPFTKDGVYLDGLVRVHNFLRSLVELRRPDLLPLLFAGKLDIEDIPALARLRERGLLRAPVHMPPWAQDRRFIVSYLAYSGFLNRIKLRAVREHYADMLAQCPEPRG